MKRRTTALLLALSMCLSLLSACGSGDTATDDKPPESENVVSSTEQQPEESEKPEESEESKEEQEESEEPTQQEPENNAGTEPAVPAEMTYTFDAATGTLTCSGGGEVVMDDWMDVVKNTLFETEEYKAKAEVKKVVVERGVTSLGKRAFYKCQNLSEAVLSDTLTSIGQDAFHGTALTGIVIPESVTELGGGAFEECQNLASANLPGGLTEIPDSLFFGCESLTSIEIPKGVTKIGGYAFQESGLTELVIPGGVTAIESQFITSTSIASITLPASLTEWEPTTLGFTALTDITFLCEATMDNVESLVGELVYRPVTIHAPAGSVIEGYVNRQIQNGNVQCTFEPIN